MSRGQPLVHQSHRPLKNRFASFNTWFILQLQNIQAFLVGYKTYNLCLIAYKHDNITKMKLKKKKGHLKFLSPLCWMHLKTAHHDIISSNRFNHKTRINNWTMALFVIRYHTHLPSHGDSRTLIFFYSSDFNKDKNSLRS